MRNALGKVGRSIGRHRKAAATIVLAVAVGVAIVTVSPWSISSYSLNASGVWVQKGDAAEAHRVDASVHSVDAKMDEVQGASVVQDGQEVLVANSEQLRPFDGTKEAYGRPTLLGAAYPNVNPGNGGTPGHEGVVLNGGVLAVRGSDNQTTEVWVGTFDGSTITLPPHPQITFARTHQSDVQIAVGRDGTAIAYSNANHVLARLVPGGRVPSSSTVQVSNSDAPQLTVVNGQGAVLFPKAKTIEFGDGGAVDVSGAGSSPDLQSWNGTGLSVGLASDNGLYSVSEGQGLQRLLSVTANQPVRPVVDARGCVYGAWGSGASAQIRRVCPSSGPSVVATRTIAVAVSQLAGVGAACTPGGLTFRGDPLSPVLQSDDGCAFVAVGDHFYAIPWGPVTPPTGTQTPQIQERDSKKPVPEIKTRPVHLYARIGTDAHLPVLEKDYDAAGDQLWVAAVSPSSGAQVPSPPVPAPDGRTVELDLRTGAGGLTGQDVNFTYTVANNRGQSAQGAVVVTIIGLNEKSPDPPTPLPGHESPTLSVVKDIPATYDVLKDWVSSDGMPLTISDASVLNRSGTKVTWSSTGWITVSYDGTPNTVVSVTVQAFDGQTGSYPITLKDSGTAGGCPVVVDDVAVGMVGSPVTVQPLKNDQDPSGSGLQLGPVTPLSAGEPTSTVKNGSSGNDSSVEFSPMASSGSASYSYVAKTSQCPDGTVGYIRLQIDPASTLPIAMPFSVDVPSGGAATVDVLSHAIDPAGGVLALTDAHWETGLGGGTCSAPSPGCGGVTSLIDHTGQLRLVDQGGAPGPVGILDYSISNASGPSTAQIFVFRTVPAVGEPTLVCHDMTATVAPGGVVSVPVLQQAWSSYGRTMNVTIATITGYPAPDTAWPDGSSIRYFAPSSASGKVTIPYQIATGVGTDTPQDCFVVVQVVSNSTNPLNPQDLDVSVAVNGSTIIPVPLTTRYDGTPVDPNGSSVVLVGEDTPPATGKAVLNPDGTSFTYTAGEVPGPAQFTYQVKNQVGTVGQGTVRILVLSANTKFAPPVAAPDTYRLVPGTSVNLPVLENDADPQGRPLGVKLLPATQNSAMGASVTPDGLDLHVTVPQSCPTKDAAGNCQWILQYEAVASGEPSASTTVTIQSAPSAGLPPVAHDVFVAYPRNGSSTSLSLAPYVTNPGSGAVTFSLVSPPPTASVDPSGQFRVALQQHSEAIVYSATDPGTKLKAYGVIWVPGLVAQPPTLNPNVAPLKINVRTGQDSVPVDVSEYLSPPQGAKLNVTKCGTSDLHLTITSCPSLQLTLTADNSIRTGSYQLYVTATASDQSGVSQPVTLPIDVDVTGDTELTVQLDTVTVPLTDTTTSNPIDLFPNVNCSGCQRSDLKFNVPSATGPVTVSTSQGGSIITLYADTGTNRITETDKLVVSICPPSNPSGCKNVTYVVQLVPPTVTVKTSQCVLTVAVNQSGTCDLTQYINASVSDNATPAILTVDHITGQPQGWTSAASGLALSITPASYSATPVTLTYVVSNNYDPGKTTTGTVVVTTEAKPDQPGTPVLGPPVAKNGESEIGVTWSAPSGRGLPIDSYTATATNTSSGTDTHTCPKVTSTACTIGGLAPGKSYVVTVIATNSLGDSEPSPASAAFQTEDRPDPIAGLTLLVSPGGGQLKVGWNPPTSSAQRPVDNFVVTTSGGTCTIPAPADPAPSATCSGLTNGTTYEITVLAHNAVGDGPAATIKGVPVGIPGAPTGLASNGDEQVVDKMGQFTMTWTSPADTGGFGITNYVITSEPTGPTCAVAMNPSPQSPQSALCTNMALNQSYIFSVAAQTTPQGEGLTGQPLTGAIAQFPDEVVGLPSGTQADAPTWTQGASDPNPTVNWTEPPGLTGLPNFAASGYCVEISNSGQQGGTPLKQCTNDGNARSLVLTSLSAGQTYTAIVTTSYTYSSGQGHGHQQADSITSGVSSSYWDPVMPGKPTALSATSGLVSWSATGASSGIAGYLVTASDANSTFTCGPNDAASTSCKLEPTAGVTVTLSAGGVYSVIVEAVPPVTEPTGISSSLYTVTKSVPAAATIG